MYFNGKGLVYMDQGDRRLYVPWNHCINLMKHLSDGKPYSTYAGFPFTRKQAAHVLAYWRD